MRQTRQLSRPFERLVRFITENGRQYWGDAILPDGVTDIAKARHARVIKGNPHAPRNHEVTDVIEDIAKLRSPIRSLRTVRALGLNYAKHALETNLPIPNYPVLFYKPSTALPRSPFSDIRIPQIAQETKGLDYECELVVVIGEAGRNIPEEKVFDHILGYCVGNDISHRDWQMKRGGGQWSLGKGFDSWAPLGPGLVSPAVIPDPDNLNIQTRLNGKLVQDSNTRDMIFGVKEIVSFLSRGTTLKRGDIIFTGTPEGVGFTRTPPLWLKHGDVVEVYLEGVGTCKNRIDFETHSQYESDFDQRDAQ